MSLKTKQLIEALNNDKHHLDGLIVIAFGKDGTTHIDFGGVPEGNVRMFLHGISVLCSVAAGIENKPLVPKPEPAIVLLNKGDS